MSTMIVSGIISLVVGISTFIITNLISENNKLRKNKNKDDKIVLESLKDGLKCLLRSKLMELYNRHIDSGSISSNEYENWSRMYDAYKSLGGNGMITHMKTDIEELKLKNNK